MTAAIRIYIATLLAADYRRRRASSPVTDHVLRRFPNGGYQQVTIEVASLMLADARLAHLRPGLAPAQLRVYRALANQIERGLAQAGRQESQERATQSLSVVVHSWVRHG